jgi:peptidoglycan/xylan/chitin deacetylase (PgdA/CDA1 family)
MTTFVLTYHSHHVVGASYETNDHIAFARDLRTIDECGYTIISVDTLMAKFDQPGDVLFGDGANYVALTFDDGPIFDVDDFAHPIFGHQPSFLHIMQDFQDSARGALQHGLHATSFVIASDAARKIMESTPDADYTFLTPNSMTDAWWGPATETGLISIGNHSWDHLHPALPDVAHSRQSRADFTQVDNDADADLQILKASAYIAHRTGCRPPAFFAYPFGHVNAFLRDDYFPRKGNSLGIKAAFTTEPSHLSPATPRWSIPRFTCGHHWTRSDELRTLLSGGA